MQKDQFRKIVYNPQSDIFYAAAELCKLIFKIGNQTVRSNYYRKWLCLQQSELLNGNIGMNFASNRLQLAQRLLNNRVPRRQIENLVQMSSKTISAIKNGTYRAGRRPGRSSFVSQSMLDFMETNWAADSTISDCSMKELVNETFGTTISTSTVWRCRQRLKFVYRPPKVVQDLTPEQKELRISFCQWVLENESDLKNIVFTDESRFQCGPDNQWRRIKRGVYSESCFAKKVKFPKTIMVWGGISAGFRTPLVKCSNGVDSDEYIEVLRRSEVISSMDRVHGRGNWFLLQDGAPCHTSQKVLDWLQQQHVCVVPGWPPNSPDLNPIEMLWGVIKRKLGPSWRKGDDIWERVSTTWSEVSEKTIDALVESFLFRCRLVLRLRGESATAYLASHRPIPDGDDPESVWTSDDETCLRRYVEDLGRKWTAIGLRMDRDPMFLKNKWLAMMQKDRNVLARNSILPSIDSFAQDETLLEELRDMNLDHWLCEIGNQI